MPTDTVSIVKKSRTFETGDTRYVITAEIKPAQIVAPYLTVDLLPANRESKSLSITGDRWERERGRWVESGCGQLQDELRAAFPDDPTVQRLCDIWNSYHLGDMNAGSREQTAIIREWEAKGNRYDYGAVCVVLEDAGKLEVPIPNTQVRTFECWGKSALHKNHPTKTWDADVELSAVTTNLSGEKSQYCPVCGKKADAASAVHPKMYRYGSAWLSEACPPEIEAEVLALLTDTTPKPSPEAENRSQLARLGIKMSCEQTDHSPNMADFEGTHYKCTFSRGRKRMTVYFSQGYAHTKEPSINTVWDAITEDSRYADQDFSEFCGNLGYDEDSRKAERIYKACEHQAARLRNFLGADFDELVGGR